MSKLYPGISETFVKKYHSNIAISYHHKTTIDCNMYCKIKIEDNIIILEVYCDSSIGSNKELSILFKASNSKVLIALIQNHLDVISRLSSKHALYIGSELIKAEIAQLMKQDYIQN
uniref:DUF4346 domain-containing protein n=1 Tax=Trichogloeopsis pedicellata TaxID=1495610 RepID=A0A1G4P0E0_9FLOR|nr:Hypothetical protein ORF_1 [Trichogloeopsis pedicellata]SCW24375.1 Hypothetical protein ORF_1 [Trichogloeopsis pedicellata]